MTFANLCCSYLSNTEEQLAHELSHSQTVELDITIPDGSQPGDVLSLEVNGQMLEAPWCILVHLAKMVRTATVDACCLVLRARHIKAIKGWRTLGRLGPCKTSTRVTPRAKQLMCQSIWERNVRSTFARVPTEQLSMLIHFVQTLLVGSLAFTKMQPKYSNRIKLYFSVEGHGNQ